MRITGVRTAYLGGSSACLRVDTDSGISGYGEAAVETVPEAVLVTVQRLAARYLIGQDPMPIELHRRRLQDAFWYHADAVVSSALTGVDHALWDIKGKALGVPVYQLLGGPVRDRVRVYRWIGEQSRDNLPEQARQRVAEGITAIKFCPTPNDPSPYPRCVNETREIVRQVRAAVGDDVDLMLDPASRWKLAEARHLLAELEEFRPLFVEEPVLPEQWEYYRPLSDATSIPLAAGERMYSRAEFKPVLAAGGLAILQPDLSHAGGITECVKIAAMAEAHDVALAPHCPLGPVALAACLQVDFVSHNAMLQEQSIGIHYNTGADLLDYVLNKEDFRCDDTGSIAALPKPGLGVEIDEDRLIEAHRQPPRWRNPVWRHADGSVAEW